MGLAQQAAEESSQRRGAADGSSTRLQAECFTRNSIQVLRRLPGIRREQLSDADQAQADGPETGQGEQARKRRGYWQQVRSNARRDRRPRLQPAMLLGQVEQEHQGAADQDQQETLQPLS